MRAAVPGGAALTGPTFRAALMVFRRPGKACRHPANNYFSSFTVASMSISSSVKISVVFWKVVIASYFTVRISPGFLSDFVLMLFICRPTDSTAFSLSILVSTGSSSLNTTKDLIEVSFTRSPAI